MTTPSELAKIAEDYAELDRTDLLHMLLLTQKVRDTLKEMLYEIYAEEFDYTADVVDKLIQERLT